MARIELNIVALGNFTSVNSQIEALQAKIATLNKSVAGVGLNAQLSKDLAAANAAFKSTMLSTGQFTASTVKMASETEKFGQALVAGKLKLSDYFNIITGKSSQATASLKALTAEQVKLQNSIVMTDPMKRGVLSVYTPTQINAVADATKLATMQQNLYNISLEASSKALITWGKNTQWAGRQLTVGLTMPMVMFGAAAAKSFKDTNLELTKLQRLYGEGLTPPSQATIDKISSQVLTLGKKVAEQMGIAQTETVKVAASFAAMGREGQNLLDTTYQTQRLSKLGAVDAAQATNTVVALQNVYKVSTKDLAGAVNFLSDIQKQTTMTLADMTEAIPRVGPIMEQLGGTYKETAVMLVAMREAGIPAAQAANALKSTMASLIAPTSAAVKQFASFGINLNAIKTAGGPVQMIEALQQSLKNLSPLVREQLIEKLFGKFQFARVSALLENFGRAGSQTINALKIAGATNAQLATLANQEMKQATESGTAKWQRAIEGFKATIYPVGQKFVEMGTMILNFVNKIAKAFGHLPGPIKSVLGIFAGGAAIAGPIIMLTGLLANFAGYILKAVVNLKSLVTGGRTFKELLTPELVASQNAAQIFGAEIAKDVDAVDLLSQAIKQLTISLEGMHVAMDMGTASSAISNAASNARSISSEQIARQGLYSVMPRSLYGAFGYGGKTDFAKSKPTTGVYGSLPQGYVGATGKELGMQGLNKQLAVGNAAVDDFIFAMKNFAGETNSASRMFVTSATKYLDTIKVMADKNGQTIISEEKVEEILAQINLEYEKELLSLKEQGIKIGDENALLSEITNRIMMQSASMATNEAEWARMWKAYNTAASSTITAGKGGGGGGNSIPVRSSIFGTGKESVLLQGTGNALFLHGYNEEFLKFREKVVADFKAAAEEAGVAFDETMIAEIDKGLNELATSIAANSAETVAAGEELGIKTGNGFLSGFRSRAGLVNKQTGKGGMGTAGLGMAAMMGSSYVSGIGGGSNPMANAAGSAMMSMGMVSMLGMFSETMMAFMPEIMAVVAGLSLAYSGIKHLIEAHKAHAAAVKASFTASSDVISAYGGKIIDSTQAVYNFNTANKESAKTLSQTAKDVAEINKLKKDDPLRQVGDLLKNQNTASSVVGTVKQFAAAQVAAGMDPSKVSQMVTDLLTYAGKTEYLNAALKEITTSTKNMTSATETWINKLKNNGDASNIVATDYKSMTAAQKAYADGLLTTTNIISDQATPFQTVTDKIKALRDSSDGSINSVNALALALKNAGASAETLAAISNLANIGVTNLGEISTILMLNAAGIQVNTTDAKKTTEDVKSGIVKYVTQKQDALIKSDQVAVQAEKNRIAAEKKAAANASTAAVTKKLKDEQSALGVEGAKQYEYDQKHIKVLEANLATMKLQTSELQKQQQYQLSQADIDNQIRLAQAQGDYLKASLLQQQKSYNTSQYNQGNAQSALEKEIADLRQSIADRAQLITDKTGTSTSVSIDTSGLTLALAKLKGDTLTKNQLTSEMNTLLHDSGLTGWKVAIGSDGKFHVVVDSGHISMDNTSDKPMGTIGNPIDASKQEDYKKLHSSYGAPVYDSSGKLSKSTSGTNNGMTAANTLAYDLKWTKDTYFKYPNPITGGYDYYFYSAKDKNVIRLDSSTPGLPGKAFGGIIRKYGFGSTGAVWGPGTSMSDSIPAMLSNGEYVTRAASVAKYGTSFMDSINNGNYNPKFPNAGSASIPATSGTINGATYNITVNAGSNASADDIAKTVMDTLKRNTNMTSSNRTVRT